MRTFLFHPITFFRYKQFKGTIIYGRVILEKASNMKITNTIISKNCSFKAYPTKKTKKNILIDIDNACFSERAYVSSNGNLFIRNSSFAPNVFIGTCKHSLYPNKPDQNYKIRIENTRFVGQNVSIFGDVTISNNCVIGACSVVTKDIPANTMVVGNPARPIKYYDKSKNEWVPYKK